MVRRVRFRVLLPARIAHHRNVPGLRSHHPPHPTSTIPNVNHGRLLATSTTAPSLTPPITQRTSGTIVGVTIIVVVIAIILPRFAPTLRLAIQTVQLLTQIVIAAVLVGIVPEVSFGRSSLVGRRSRAERVLVLELLSGATAMVQMSPWGTPRRRRGLAISRRGSPLVRMMMMVVVVVVPMVVLEVMVVIGHSISTVQLRFQHGVTLLYSLRIVGVTRVFLCDQFHLQTNYAGSGGCLEQLRNMVTRGRRRRLLFN